MRRDRHDVEDFLRAAGERLGDLVLFYGARIAHGASAERGRCACPVHSGHDLNAVFGKHGRLTCFVCGKSWDALGLVAEIEHHDLASRDGFRPAVARLAEILGEADPFNEQASPKPRPTPRKAPAPVAPVNVPDVALLVSRLELHDERGEGYLASRGLFNRSSDVVRFATGRTGYRWLDRAAHAGFRPAFVVRNVTGLEKNISLRHCGDGAPWGEDREVKKKLALPCRTTTGVAIVRPTIGLLATNDPEFTEDEILLCEGGPDWLALTESFDEAAMQGTAPKSWAVGAIGASNVSSVVPAFAAILKGRTVRLCFDSDESGEKAAAAAVPLLWKAGARRVTRNRPPSKDWAQLLEASA